MGYQSIGAASTGGSNGTTSVAVNMPSGITAGDLLIGVFDRLTNGSSSATTASGWTLLDTRHDVAGGQGLQMDVWAKAAAGSDTLTFGHAGTSGRIQARALRFDGLNAAAWIAAAVASPSTYLAWTLKPGTNTTTIALSVTAVGGEIGFYAGGDPYTSSWTTDGGSDSERSDALNGSSNTSLATYTTPALTAGSVSRTITSSANQQLGVGVFVLVPQRTAVTKTFAPSWDVRSSVAQTIAPRWDVRASVAKTFTPLWNIRAPILKTYAPRWDVRATVGKTLTPLWDVHTVVVSGLSPRWDVHEVVGLTFSPRWDVRGAVAATFAPLWDVRQLVAQTLAARWDVREAIVKSFDIRWDVEADAELAPVLAQFPIAWDVRAGVTATYAPRWDVRAAVTKTFGPSWDVRAAVAATFAPTWDVRAVVAQTLAPRWDVRVTVTVTFAPAWGIRQIVTRTVPISWDVRGLVVASLPIAWAVRAEVLRQLLLRWDVESDYVPEPFPPILTLAGSGDTLTLVGESATPLTLTGTVPALTLEVAVADQTG